MAEIDGPTSSYRITTDAGVEWKITANVGRVTIDTFSERDGTQSYEFKKLSDFEAFIKALVKQGERAFAGPTPIVAEY